MHLLSIVAVRKTLHEDTATLHACDIISRVYVLAVRVGYYCTEHDITFSVCLNYAIACNNDADDMHENDGGTVSYIIRMSDLNCIYYAAIFDSRYY